MVESKAAAREFLRALVVTGHLPPPAPEGSAEQTLAAAQEQGLSGILLGAIEAQGRGGSEETLAAALREGRRAGLVRTLGQIALGERALGLLQDRGIRALPLKGAVLAETVYDIESDRPMSDVDVLALERWPDAVTALLGAGFTALARGDHAWAFTDPVSGGVLELHRSVTSCPGLFPLDVEAVWARSRGGRRQLRRWPSAEDLLLQLALHAAFQHGLVLSLVQWLDFRRVLERGGIDPNHLVAIAAEARAGVPLAAALAVAEAVVAAPVPPGLRSSLEGRLPRGLQRWLEPRLATPLAFVNPAEPRLGRVRWELLAGRRAELVWRTAVVPEGPGERASWPSRLAAAVGRAVRLARGQLLPAPAAGLPHVHGPVGPSDPPEVPFTEELVRDCLARFPFVSLTVTGRCMQPLLAHGEKIRLAGRAHRRPRLGDVVLARHLDGLRLHRLVWGPPLAPRGRWRTKADRALLLDPALDPADVLGTVIAIEGRPAARPRRVARALLSLLRGLAARRRRRPPAARAEGAS